MAGKKKRTVPAGAGSFEDLPEEVKAFVQALTFGAAMETEGENGFPPTDRSSFGSGKPTKKIGRKKRTGDT